MTGIYGVIVGERSGDSQASGVFKQYFDESPLLSPTPDLKTSVIPSVSEGSSESINFISIIHCR